MKRLVIVGAGTAGTLMANKLARALPEAWRITLVDRDDVHVYQPGLLFLPFGQYRDEDIVKPRSALLEKRVELRLEALDRIAAADHKVTFKGGEQLAYDVLIIATGSRILPEQTQGLTGDGWGRTAFDFYTLEGAQALRRALFDFKGGRLVINIAELPIKCPVAPLEFAFLADAFLAERGVREKTELVYVTPLDGAFTKPRASAALGQMLEQRHIKVVPDFMIASADGTRRVITAYDGREEPYDLLVEVPLHGGAEVITASGLGDGGGWVPTDKHTLQSKAFPDVFVLGDATDLTSSKAGSVAHFQGEVLFDNVLRFIEGRALEPGFDGHANCFIESGRGKAMLIDFNSATEPLPGRFPLPGIGPFTLLEESAVNHWGKLGFKWVYWNLLVAGKELPFDHRMVLAGKWA